ncbi:hypothetical protein ABPG72_005904 [Tetrahymena utriculariae]
MEIKQIFLQKIAQYLLKYQDHLSRFQFLVRSIYCQKTKNPDSPFRLEFRPSRYCPANAMRKRKTREDLRKFGSLLSGNAIKRIYTFLELLEINNQATLLGNNASFFQDETMHLPFIGKILMMETKHITSIMICFLESTLKIEYRV